MHRLYLELALFVNKQMYEKKLLSSNDYYEAASKIESMLNELR